jgi:hypothetical protein
LIYDDTPKTKNTWPPKNKGDASKYDERIIEIVKFLARASAEKDYNQFIQENNPPEKEF